MPAHAERPLLVIDGDNLAHRAYHSTPKTVTGVGGATINALVGFVSMLVNVWNKETPRGVFVAWDTLGVDTYRSELWPPYQGGRIFEREIVQQLDVLPTLCTAFGFGVGKSAGSEADDLMAAAVAQEVKQGGSCLVLTTDKDSYQLVSEHVTVLSPKRGAKELERIGPKEVVERFGVLPEQVTDFKALSGDSSDRIPGIRGIGPVAAKNLLLQHGTLDHIVATWTDPAQVELALKFREVVQMRPTMTVVLPESEDPDWLSGSEALQAIGAETLAARIKAMANPGS